MPLDIKQGLTGDLFFKECHNIVARQQIRITSEKADRILPTKTSFSDYKMLFPCRLKRILTTSFGFLSAALLYVSFAAAEAEEANSINFRLKKTIGSGESKQDGLDVIFPGYYPDSVPVDLPENKTAATTTADPIHADGTPAAPKRKSTSGYPVDWSAVADHYYRSVDGGSRKKSNGVISVIENGSPAISTSVR